MTQKLKPFETERDQRARINVDRSLRSEIFLCLQQIDTCLKSETPEQAFECLKSAFGLAGRIQNCHWQNKAIQDLRKIYEQNRETANAFNFVLE